MNFFYSIRPSSFCFKKRNIGFNIKRREKVSSLKPYTKGIVRDTDGMPAVITENEISVLKNYLNGTVDDDGFFSCNIGEKVKIISGPMIYKSGVVEKINNKTVTITLKSLNIKIVINKSNLIAA